MLSPISALIRALRDKEAPDIMSNAPVTALVMHPVVRDELLRADHIQRLKQCCRLISDTPFRNFDEPGEALKDTEILITSWGCPRIDTQVLAKIPKLKMIAHLAGTVKGFLDEQVWQQRIAVTNAVAANAVPVAEYTLAAILFANKRVFQLRDFYREHRENRAPWTLEAPNVGNYQKTIGVVGASQVGRCLLKLLLPFDFKVLLYDPYITPLEAREMGAHKTGLVELLCQSDVVTLHTPLLADTQHMIGKKELRLMKDHSTLINTARGAIIDQEALIAELKVHRIYAILDTTDPDVLPPESPLYRLPNVFLTPHIAGSMGSETQRLADYIVEEVERFTRGKRLQREIRFEELARLA